MFKAVFKLALFGAALALAGCGPSTSYPFNLTLTSAPAAIAGGSSYTFTATQTNSTTSAGVTWTLAINTPSSSTDTTTPCTTTSCGTILNAGTSTTSRVTSGSTTYYTTVTSLTYTAPLTPPTPNSIVLTVTAPTNTAITADTTFTIGAPAIVVRLENTFTTIAPSAAPVTLTANVQYDTANAGVTWALKAAGNACSPVCGTLTAAPAPSFTATYTPPASVPAAPNNSPTITATSVTDTTKSAFDSFTIQAPGPPISVQITNPFTSIVAGSPGVTINAQVTNDVNSEGVTWSISPSSNTGALSANQALSVLYTPPNTAPQPPFNTPTITATSVADNTKSASFTFTIESSADAEKSACSATGSYVFQLSGTDSAGKPIVMVGAMTIDSGKVMITSVDVNDGLQITSGGGVSGECTIARTDFGIQAVLISLDGELPLYPALRAFDLDFPAHSIQRALLTGRDADRHRVMGEVILQNPTTLAQFGGDFVFHLRGNASSGAEGASPSKSAILGRFTLSFDGAKGLISAGRFDASYNDGAEVSSDVSLRGAATPPDASGRGSINFSAGQGSHAFAYYAASADQFVLAEMDTTPWIATGMLGGGVPGADHVDYPILLAGGADGQSLDALPKNATGFALGIGARNSTYDSGTGRFSTVHTDPDGEKHPSVIYFTGSDTYWLLDVTSATVSFSIFSVAP